MSISIFKKVNVKFVVSFLCISFVICFQSYSLQDTNYYSAGKILNFADYLYDTKDYMRAAKEYQKLLSLPTSTVGKDNVLYKIALCYMSDKQFSIAISYFKELITGQNRDSDLFVERYIKNRMFSLFLFSLFLFLTFDRRNKSYKTNWL